ncbi:MAG TPA: hypothetical protein VGO80_10670 [Solirubrobacteraceae bacterium]|jgi:hypothetical protein|nr:hypothetical protein [Solirubrobacteraceae bacterium]
MIELALLAVFSRLMTWGLGPVIAERTVAADGDVLRDVLADPANQRRLIGAVGDIRVTATTPRVVRTELRVAGRTIAWLTWILSAARGTTSVTLALQLESRGVASRLVVLLGGRWMRRRLDMTLASLATTSARAAEAVLVPPSAPAVRAPARRRKKAPACRTNHAALHR